MKQHSFLSKITAMLLILCLSFATVLTVAAEDVVDGSYLTEEQKSEGISVSGETRGVHLMDGKSSIANQGSGRIYVSGTTTANHSVAYISVTVTVQRLINGAWKDYYAWGTSAYNTYFVGSNKTLQVPQGYYYRVACSHSAGNAYPYDQASSFTNAIWI